MKPSDADHVRDMYDASAAWYSEIMDSEIDLPVYADILERLQSRITGTPGLLVDTSCGSGHMLERFRERYDPRRPLLGIDLSLQMVSIATERLGPGAEIVVGDMRDLTFVGAGTAVAALSFFAIQHLDSAGVGVALVEWHRILSAGGQLLIAAWEGSGTIDFGDDSDVVALRYDAADLADAARFAGFTVDRCAVEPVEGFPMDAIYIEATK